MNKRKETIKNSIFQNMKRMFVVLMLFMFIMGLFTQDTKAVINGEAEFYDGKINDTKNKMIDSNGKQNKNFVKTHNKEYKKRQRKWRRRKKWQKQGKKKDKKDKKEKQEEKKVKTHPIDFIFVDAAAQMNKKAAERYHDIDRSKGDDTQISCTYRILIKSDGEYQPYIEKIKNGKSYKDKLPAGEYKLEMERNGYMPTSYSFKVPEVTDGYIRIQRVHTGLELKVLGGSNPNQKTPLKGVKVSIWNADKTAILKEDYTFSGTGEPLVKKTNKKGIVRFPLVKGDYWVQVDGEKVKGIRYSANGEKFQKIKVMGGRGKIYKGYKHKSPNPRNLNGNTERKERVDKKGRLKLNIKFTKDEILVDSL